MPPPNDSAARGQNPTDAISLDFAKYVTQRKAMSAAHMVNGRPDYAFTSDYQMRQRLAAVGPLRKLAEILTAASASIRRQSAFRNMAEVGPTQFPQLFEINRHCAETLGIPVPSLFIESSPQVNGYTIATDDLAPLVVITSAAVDVMTDDELCFIIGHECGHIHNLHGLFNLMGVLASNTALVGTLIALPSVMLAPVILLIQQGTQLGLNAWSRAGEVTCDRAGLICTAQPETAASALAKLAAPVRVERMGPLDPEALAQQAERVRQTPLRMEEALYSHPIVSKRIAAVRLFAQSDVFAQRRPDVATETHPQSIDLINKQVEELISIL